MHLSIKDYWKYVSRAAFVMTCVVMISAGCNQQRYKPAPWRPAARNTTMPENKGTVGDQMVRWTSLPMATLPMRTGSGSTLPNRGGNWTTLPNRGGNWTTLPNRGMTTLPQRGGQRGFPLPNWNTLPNRGGPRGMTTLPGRQTYPEYRLPRRNWTTLPGSENR